MKTHHPDTLLTPKTPAPLHDCPTCGATMRCPACRSPRVVLMPPGEGYWATCRDCGYPIGGGA